MADNSNFNFEVELPDELLSLENLELDDIVLDEDDDDIDFETEPVIVSESIIEEADELEINISDSTVEILFQDDRNVTMVQSYNETSKDKEPAKPAKTPNHFCAFCGKPYIILKYKENHEKSCGSKSVKKLGQWKDEAQSNGLQIFKSSVREAANDKIFLLKPTSQIHVLIKQLQSKLESQEHKEINTFINTSIIFLFHCIPEHPSKIESCTFKLEEVTSSKSLWNLWQPIFVEFSENKEMRILFHFVLTKIHKELWALRNNLLDDSLSQKDLDLKLMPQEENTLRYVAGYIPYVLLRKLEDQKETPSKSALLLVLHSWNKEQGGKVMPFLDYTREWTDKINRGGAYVINDDFYIFIRRLENVIRTVLNRNLMVTYAGEDMRPIILTKFDQSSLVRMAWDSLTKDLSDSLSEYLRKAVFKVWINIRANAFIKAWVTIIKLKKNSTANIDNKGKPALRKQLSG